MSRKSFFPPDPVIPSTITSVNFVSAHAPDHDKILEKLDEDEIKCGKWMLFYNDIEISPSRGLTHLDYAWQFIKKFVEKNSSEMTGLISAKCSTGWRGPRNADPSSNFGVICCFTIDYRDKWLAKKAANAIRQVCDYPKHMYYKTDEDTRAMRYRHLGHRFVSIYKYTTENEMFERDMDVPCQWNRV